MHGLDQSQALTRAAQALSAARLALRAAVVEDITRKSPQTVERREAATAAVEDARMVYDAAYKAYTNPFNVVKSVAP